MRVPTTTAAGPVHALPQDLVDREFSQITWTNFSGQVNVIAGRGDRVLLSTPKGEIGGTGTLADEIAYLTGDKGYVWVNQWSLRPGG